MKRLSLIRHANARSEREGFKDFDRPLSNTGIEEARAAAQRFKAEHGVPDLIVSSPAQRAISTARIFAEVLGYDAARIETNERIYLASAGQLAAIIADTSDDTPHLALFGHNPSISDLARSLKKEPGFLELHTSGYRSVELSTAHWRDWNA